MKNRAEIARRRLERCRIQEAGLFCSVFSPIRFSSAFLFSNIYFIKVSISVTVSLHLSDWHETYESY